MGAHERERDCSLARVGIAQLKSRITELDEAIPNQRARRDALEARANALCERRVQMLAEHAHHASLIAGAELAALLDIITTSCILSSR